MKKINIVTVIRTKDSEVVTLTSFEDTQQGNAKAEKWFAHFVRLDDGSVSDEDMEGFIENGHYDSLDGESGVEIHHSQVEMDA